MSAPAPAAAAPIVTAAEEKVAAATQLQLTWWRFRKHKLAVASGIVVVLFYLMALLGDFLAVTEPHATDAARSYIPPQAIHFFDEGAFRPHVYALKGKRDMRTFKLVYAPDPSDKRYLRLFAPGFDAIGEAEVRKRFYQESAICQKFAVEARLRGLVTDADWKKKVNL